MTTPLIRALVWGALIALSAVPSDAQSSLQVPLQFDLVNPGAKSLAMGGAFTGLADDATATFANPAGLTQLGASEVSVEFRATRTSTPFLESGRLSGAISNQATDTVPGPIFADSIGTIGSLGFVAGVYVPPSGRWVLAAHRHELMRVDQSFLSKGVFQKDPEEFTSRRQAPLAGDRLMSVTGYGVSGALKVTPNVSVGGTLSLYSFRIDSLYRRFDVDGFLGPPVLSREFQRTTQQGDDVGVAPTAGVVVGSSSADPGASLLRRARLGVVYRHGPSFEYTTQGEGVPPIPGLRFQVPHTLAAGASLRINSQLVVATELTFLNYARTVDDFVTDQARDQNRGADFSIANGAEVHAGVQYALPRFKLIPRIRGGVWFDPDHSVKFEPSRAPQNAFERTFNEFIAAASSKGASQVHGSAGVGLTLHPRAELNVATDFARDRFRFSTSFIVR